MADLSTISGIGNSSLELLEAAGFLDVESLAKAGIDDLVRELERANQILRISKSSPSPAQVGKWIGEARKRSGLDDLPAAEPSMPVNYEATAQVLELLASAPLAIPLPARQLIDCALAVSDIPPAILLNRYVGNLEIRVTARDPSLRVTPYALLRSSSRSQSTSEHVQLSEGGPQRIEIDTSRLRSVADLEKTDQRTPSSKNPTPPGSTPNNDRVNLLRAPLESTNRGRNPRSRFYVRGVLHTDPIGMMLGAITTLIMMILLPVAIGSSVLLLFSDVFPESFSWVSVWLLVFPCSVPVFGIFYLIYGLGGRCRICTQRMFAPRGCRKNAKAHHIRGLGYIIPASLHMLVFRWFRCTHCGTPVRLKK